VYISHFRSSIFKILSDIRRAQVKIRTSIMRLKALGDKDTAIKLTAMNDILERIALRLETMLILGYVNSELVKTPLALTYAIEVLKAYTPPDIHYTITITQEAIEKLIVDTLRDFPQIPIDNLRNEARLVLEEALKNAERAVEKS